jgi:hypothetical protein
MFGLRVVSGASGVCVFFAAAVAQPESASIAWTFRATRDALPVAVAIGGGRAWLGRAGAAGDVLRFDLAGSGDATTMLGPLGDDSPAILAASADGQRVVVLDTDIGGGFVLRSIDPAGGAVRWSAALDPEYSLRGGLEHCLVISRDGGTIALGLNRFDAASRTTRGCVCVIDGASGMLRRMWETPASGLLASVSISDDGSMCVVSDAGSARVVDMRSGLQVLAVAAAGTGGRHVISGNGETVVIAGFSLAVYRRVGGGYARAFTVETPGEWFGWGAAVSRDGRTVGALSHDLSTYRVTRTRIWDVASGRLTGESSREAAGEMQDASVTAAMSDDGWVFAAATWGAEGGDGAAPEVRVVDRFGEPLGAVDLPGSPVSMSLTRDGRMVVVASRGAHMNLPNPPGVWGDVTAVRLPDVCRADFNVDGSIDFFDYLDFASAFASADVRADFNSDGVIDFFDYLDFVGEAESSCS